MILIMPRCSSFFFNFQFNFIIYFRLICYDLNYNMNKRISIIGIGNIFMGDDGVGASVLELLKNESLPGNVSIINKGTRGLSLIHTLAEFDIAIIIDAVDFGGKPGETCCFTPGDVKSTKQISGLSTHECDLLTVIELSKKLDECPGKIIIMGIQPSSMAPTGELSPSIKMKLHEIVKSVMEVIHNENSQ
ncbi:MAG: hydrogenase maturation protease [Candidatus Altiarchaeales archaeon HGW-Altiarchaeales-3]|nr:MAG: hydrogenase maturation protease [Candidatus Altiarchaeales archaeon HGW-Altiarchaeales-3]